MFSSYRSAKVHKNKLGSKQHGWLFPITESISTKDLVIMTTGGIYMLGMGAGTMEIKLCNEKRQELLTV